MGFLAQLFGDHMQRQLQLENDARMLKLRASQKKARQSAADASPSLPNAQSEGDQQSLIDAACYGRGIGFTDKQWATFDKDQRQSADDNDVAAARLRRAATAMEAGGTIDKFDQRTVKDFNVNFGSGAATIENMRLTADRYDKSSGVLRDQSTYMANGYSHKDYQNLPGSPSKNSFMSTPAPDRTIVDIDMDNPDYRDPSRRRWGIRHESFHTKNLKLADQTVGIDRAYKYGRDDGKAFQALKKDVNSALLNPDHLVSFAQDYWRKPPTGAK